MGVLKIMKQNCPLPLHYTCRFFVILLSRVCNNNETHSVQICVGEYFLRLYAALIATAIRWHTRWAVSIAQGVDKLFYGTTGASVVRL